MDLTYATEFVAHYQWILVLILLAMLLHWIPLRWNDIIVQKMAQQKAWVLWLYVVTMLIAIAWGKADVPVTPIYLQF
jgi:hypothetical protein